MDDIRNVILQHVCCVHQSCVYKSVDLINIVMEQLMEIDRIPLTEGESISDVLKKRWNCIETMDNIFRYKLNVEKYKILAGKFHLFVEVKSCHVQ